MTAKPALGLVGVPTKRAAILELAAEAERRGFAGLASPGVNGNLALAGSLAHVTSEIPFWSSIQPIYTLNVREMAITAGHLAEVSGGRFRLGIGVSHASALQRMGVHPGKPLGEMREYVAGLRASEPVSGPLPPIWLATLRDRMLALALEVADGALWANAAFSYTSTQITSIDAGRRESFALGNMVPTVLDDDRDAAREIHRRTLAGYVTLPNYRNYWKAAGYTEEMEAMERALAAGERDRVPALMTERWLDDCTISGSASQVLDAFAAWQDIGVTPIAMMSSTSGGQAHAIRQLFAAYG